MKITVRYSARYQYAQKASFSPHRVRLFPRHDLFVHIERISFSTDASARVQYRHDLFDNAMAICLYPASLDRLDFELEFDAVLEAWDPFHFLLDSHALRLPFDYLPEEAAVLAPFRHSRYETGDLPAPLSPASPQPTVEAIVALNNWLHENIEYERRDEGDPFAPKETLDRQKGSCRDFAVLLTEVLRRHERPLGLQAAICGRILRSTVPNTPPTHFTPGLKRIYREQAGLDWTPPTESFATIISSWRPWVSPRVTSHPS